MFMDLDILGRIDLLASPTAHSLSHKIVVEGCGYPRRANIVRSSHTYCALPKTAVYSASDTAANITGIRVLTQNIGTLKKVGSLIFPRK